jgi:hypothetical protein
LLAALYSYAAGEEKAPTVDVACQACDPAIDKEAEVSGDFDRADRHAVMVAYISIFLGSWESIGGTLTATMCSATRKAKAYNPDMVTKDT